VQDLNVSAILIKPNAEDHQENLAEESTESKKERTLRKNKEIDEIIVREVDVSKKWKPYCKKVAERKCGKGAEHKVCRKRVRKQIHQKESTFRRNALRSCACKSKHSKCEENKAGRCAKKYNRCSRRCLKKACKTRAKTECAGKQSEIKCRRETVKRCKNLHHHHKRHAKKERKHERKEKIERRERKERQEKT